MRTGATIGWNEESSPLTMRVPLLRLRLAIMQRPRFGRLATVNIAVTVFDAAVVVTVVVAAAVLLAHVLVVAAGVAVVAWRHLFL